MSIGAETVTGSLGDMCSFSSKDWGACREDAWLYGIVCGWGDEHGDGCDALPEIQARFGWSDAAMSRLARLRELWRRLELEGR